MKRPRLVTYSDSSGEEESGEKESVPNPPVKKRKLPPISSSIVAPGPVDIPALHQGRIRTTPHVEGQFAAHVYVSLALGRQSLLYKVLQGVLRDAKEAIPTLRDIWSPVEANAPPDLHISLSRPIFLRAHQREDLKRAVKNIAKAHKPFVLSFAMLSELINDERTRTFLTIEVGAGHLELRSLSDALTPVLQAIRQQGYYANPRFHASFAWALLHRPQGPVELKSVTSDDVCTPPAASEDLQVASSDCTGKAPDPSSFPTIACLPPEVVKSLNERYGKQFSAPKVGAFNVDSITVKIGKDITSWRILGI
ncbi:hypothetical protein M413DRAFT_26402 [Hebeloma cylindrosporum]|uniref:U6 snRNA phosphodiesterase n=1 Tax=Hebeloma cylindrosporum TaxID=76867 RepID=A0A0C3CGE9_HEBCY|nr:hypothetical protein M413DRAFT_26402 [Hebeloma cylindrosporum h7]